MLIWWIPVGAGGHVVRYCSQTWGLIHAAMARRAPRPLFHAALEVRVDTVRYVIEMTPAWGMSPGVDRGVVGTGPVGLQVLGRLRFFRYEVRCWPDGELPGRGWAQCGDAPVSQDAAVARTLVSRSGTVPLLTWGRSVPGARDMWNSNSVVAWLLTIAGADVSAVVPPDGGWAPGWQAGIAKAAASARPPG